MATFLQEAEEKLLLGSFSTKKKNQWVSSPFPQLKPLTETIFLNWVKFLDFSCNNNVFVFAVFFLKCQLESGCKPLRIGDQ